ncbi:hypothetical protein DQT32_03535 [Salmonella enterica subsp. enterica serovar Braenderup]|nr:hypothetical protein [Salmonella enterica subsp. enterica serovar Braenderup]
MNEKMKKGLEAAAEAIRNMPRDEFFKSVFGFTPEEEDAYTEEKFLEELNYLRTFFVDGAYCFEPKYNGEPEAKVTKLFWNFISKNARSKYEDTTEVFPTYYDELPNYGIRVTTVHGQGSISIVEEFDYNTVEYMARNATRLKREGAWREQERIKELLRDKPNCLDEVKFSTVIDGVEVHDTGVITKVYTKKDVIRYLVDTVNYGEIIIFYENEKYPLDKIEVTLYHSDNYDSY